MKRFILLLVSIVGCVRLSAQPSYDQGVPFGFATCTSRTSSGTYNVTGGGGWLYDNGTIRNATGTAVSSSKVKVLTSTGQDMASAIRTAIQNYSVVVFDGSNGDFLISSTISLSGLQNKTLLGINGARLCTQWYMTPQLQAMLDTVVTSAGIGVKTASTASGGGTLSNGAYVKEEREYLTRRTLLAHFGNENYQSSGVFFLNACSNWIIRNLRFVGPGSVDVGGSDLLSFYGSTKHMWVDHCDFTDGMDGNFDITQKSDFITVSWCTFSYTSRAYDHMNTNLVGSSDSETTGYLNITFANNVWGARCNQRMPMARVGKIHMLNNYFCCTGASCCINPRLNSEFLIEGNYFESGVKNVFSQSGATAVIWSTTNQVLSSSAQVPSSFGSVTLPYTYTAQSAASVKSNYLHAGATLYGSVKIEDILLPDNHYVIELGDQVYGGQKVIAPALTMTFGQSSYNAAVAQSGITGYDNYLVGTDNPSVKNNIPSSGTYYQFVSTVSGTLELPIVIGSAGKVTKVSRAGTLIGFTLDGAAVSSAGYTSTAREVKMLSVPMQANTTYYVFTSGSKLGILGWNFTPSSGTSLDAVKKDAFSAKKIIRNGQILLRTPSATYTIFGQER